MRLFIFFVIAAFLVGGSALGPRLERRPIIVLGACAVVGALFYSYRSLG